MKVKFLRAYFQLTAIAGWKFKEKHSQQIILEQKNIRLFDCEKEIIHG